MEISSRYHSYTSTLPLQRKARRLLVRLRAGADHLPLARFLLKIRLLPLGRPGILALGRLTLSELTRAEILSLKSSSKTRKDTVALPNVFRGLEQDAVRQFLKAARDPGYLRKVFLEELGIPTNKHFSLSRLGRLFEAVVGDFHSSVLIRIYNFRGPPARWPSELLPEGGDWVAKVAAPPSPILVKRRIIFPFIRRVCCDFRNWSGQSDHPSRTKVFTFPVAPKTLSVQEALAYRILLEIVRLRIKSGTPKSDTSLAKYLSLGLSILQSEAGGRKYPKITKVLLEAERRVLAARISLGLPNTKVRPHSKKVAPRVLELNLIPIRFLEKLVFSDPPAVEDTPRSTIQAILLIDLFTGRRISDFADATLADFSRHFGLLDLTISSTKVRSTRGIKLPQHRLLPPPALSYVNAWLNEIVKKYRSNLGITLFELVTGTPRIVGSPKGAASQTLDNALIRSLGGDLSRIHIFRYAYGTWGAVAAVLAWQQELREHPMIAPWVRDSWFFSDGQMEQWKELIGSSTADPILVVSQVLGHINTGELQRDYCIAWVLLAAISAAAAPQGR